METIFPSRPSRIISRTLCWYGSLSHCDPICTTCLPAFTTSRASFASSSVLAIGFSQ
jgi:hypothetical protein